MELLKRIQQNTNNDCVYKAITVNSLIIATKHVRMQLFQTKDHSHTIYLPELDETYHSRNGAVEEAMYVYIGRGLLDRVAREESAVRSPLPIAIGTTVLKSQAEEEQSNIHPPTSNLQHPFSILEIGFGTGLNAWLTALECVKTGIRCDYHSLETFPLSLEIVSQLNYSEKASEADQQLFLALHKVDWNTAVTFSDNFTLTKHEVSLQAFVPNQQFDIIYFDAFAPEKQPELWTEELFQKLYDCLNPNGVIVTYSSKGDIKRLWKKIGFEVERLPGPPMKRHMLRGRKMSDV